MARNFEMVLDVDAFIPPASNHADKGVLSTQNRIFIAFDASTVEAMYSKAMKIPEAYTGTGTLKADIFYIAASATSGKFDFEISIEAITPLDATDLDTTNSFDSVNSQNKTVPATAGHLDSMTITLTNKDSLASGDIFRIKLERDADDGTDDTAAGDARVLSVVIYEER